MTPASPLQDPPSPTFTTLVSENEVSESFNEEQTEKDPDQSKTETKFTDCTTTPKDHINIEMSDPSTSTTNESISPAYTINASLSKISVNDKLTDSNYISWAISIQRALRSVGLQKYIKNESLMSHTKHFDTHCDCITNWILNSMDSVNANRMQSRIMVPNDENLELIYSPQQIWEETRRYHAPCTEAV